jgi:SAM-dependent methyltransferase
MLKRLIREALRRRGIGVFNLAREKIVPQDAFVVSPAQSIYDPAVFGVYDRASQMVVPRGDRSSVPFDLDIAAKRAQSYARQGGAALDMDRYRLVLDLLQPGSGLCLDACTTDPRPETRAAVEARGYQYLAIDIEEARGVRREDLTALSFADGAIARILSLDTLEHIDAYPAAIRELFRVLAPWGLAYVHVPVYYFDKPVGEPIRPGVDPWGHVRYFAAREFLRLFEEAGFVILRACFNLDYGALIAVLGKEA